MRVFMCNGWCDVCIWVLRLRAASDHAMPFLPGAGGDGARHRLVTTSCTLHIGTRYVVSEGATSATHCLHTPSVE